jgi:hypothetical protein
MKQKLTSIITGDIIHSKRSTPKSWLNALKSELRKSGSAPKQWEIFRGDSFQLEVKNPLDAICTAIKIKASIRKIGGVDVRMAIGIGTKTHNAEKITVSNGSAFVFSGDKFETLKKEKQTLAICSEWKTFDNEINLYLRLGLIAMDNWTMNAAEIVRIALENPDMSQENLGKRLGIKQNAVSGRLKRARFEEINEVINIYRSKLKTII